MAPLTDIDDYSGKSNSASGIPDWATSRLQGWLNKPAALKSWNRLDTAMGELAQVPQFIEQKRRLLGDQYDAGVGEAARNAVNSAVSSAFGRGIQNSSMMGDYLKSIAGQLGQSAQQAHSAGNIWAADATTGALKDRAQMNMGMAGLLGDLLGLSRYSSASSIQPPAWVPGSDTTGIAEGSKMTFNGDNYTFTNGEWVKD